MYLINIRYQIKEVYVIKYINRPVMTNVFFLPLVITCRSHRQIKQQRPCRNGLMPYLHYASFAPPEICGGSYHVRMGQRHRVKNRPRYELFVAEQTQKATSVFQMYYPAVEQVRLGCAASSEWNPHRDWHGNSLSVIKAAVVTQEYKRVVVS